MKTILITGGAGYVGTLLSEQLSKKYKIIVYDTFWFGDYIKSKKITKIKGDIRDTNKLKSIKEKIDIVIHLACISNDVSFELNEKLSEYLDAANDGCAYAFLEGHDEQVFSNYSLLEQKNGSFGIGETPDTKNMGDPTRMISLSDNTNKNRTLDSLMASRSTDLENFNKK